jgi:hypothetical protein
MTVFIFTPTLFAQPQGNWPEPSVALFDCNSSAASTGSASQTAAINSASKLILQNILGDSSCKHVVLISYGFADTMTTDFLSASGTSFPFPDTGGVPDVNYDYVIASKIVGNPGSYTLTVSIEDGYTYAHVADGTATFDSATGDTVRTACLSAVRQILPLTTKIRNYQESLKAANPLLTINPQIDVSLAKINLPPDGSLNVVITATDCDGLPIANRQLTLESTLGSFSSSSVQTDESGKAEAVFNAGKSEGTSLLTASIQNSISVTHDTIYPSGSASLIIGDVDTTNLWVLEFDLRRFNTSCLDKLTQQGEISGWLQKNYGLILSAHGKIICTSTNETNTEFEFDDPTMSVYGMAFQNYFSKDTKTNQSGAECPNTSWDMRGSSQNWVAKADSNHHGSASFKYDPQGLTAFTLIIPFTCIDYYAYGWSIDGQWDENGGCKTNSVHSGFKVAKIDMGSAIVAMELNSVFTVFPSYAGSSAIGYTILFDSSSSGYLSDASFYAMRDLCIATLKPFSSPPPTAVKKTGLPKKFFLAQNHPDPFNPSITISFSLPTKSFVSLKVFDLNGREAATIVSEELPVGSYTKRWNANAMARGMYYYRFQAGTFTETKKIVLLK